MEKYEMQKDSHCEYSGVVQCGYELHKTMNRFN